MYLSVAAILIALMSLCIGILLARQVAFLTQYLGPLNAREESAGPRIGEDVSNLIGHGHSEKGIKNLYVFVSKSCGICKSIDGDSMADIARSWKGKIRITYMRDEAVEGAGFDTKNNVWSMGGASKVRTELGIDFVPMCIVTDHLGRVVLKGMPNHVAHIDNLINQATQI